MRWRCNPCYEENVQFQERLVRYALWGAGIWVEAMSSPVWWGVVVLDSLGHCRFSRF